MATNNFNSDIETAAIQSAQYFIADDGSLRFISPYLSSSNFDGGVPIFDGQISASSIQRGMFISLDGSIGSDYYPVVKVIYDDPDLLGSQPTVFDIVYLDSSNKEQTITYNALDLINVRYENWAEKYLGNQGWTLTSGGNAIFTNVGVRGEIEATTLDVGGEDGITYDGSTVIIGASVVINAPVTFNGSSSYVTYDYLSSSYASLSAFSASIDGLYNAGFVTDNDLITNGATSINGNNITTGIINANLVNVTSGLTGPSQGIKINSLGLFAYNASGQQTARINSSNGSASFVGGIFANNGYFGFDNTIRIGSTASSGNNTSAFQIGTLQIVGQSVSGNTYGSLSFFNTAGAEVGSIATRRVGSKGSVIDSDGLIIGGSTSEYLFIPAPTSSSAAQYRGGGFRWYDGSNNEIMSIVGGAGGLRVKNTSGGIQVTSGNIELSGGGNYKLNGSNLSTGTSYVLSTSGPSSPSSYADGTVWYVY